MSKSFSDFPFVVVFEALKTTLSYVVELSVVNTGGFNKK